MTNPLVHLSVLLTETVQAVLADVDGIYVDATFGRGGHSRALLATLGSNARLLAFDKDPEAINAGEKHQVSTMGVVWKEML